MKLKPITKSGQGRATKSGKEDYGRVQKDPRDFEKPKKK